jgi:hypothetical protein
MKECLNCQTKYPCKRPHSKFCSVNCRVMYNRKHPKQSVTPIQMQVLYNSMLEMIESAKFVSIPPLFGVVTKDEVKMGETVNEPVKVTLRRPFATLQALINECESAEAYEPLRKEIEEATHLSAKEKAILLRKR